MFELRYREFLLVDWPLRDYRVHGGQLLWFLRALRRGGQMHQWNILNGGRHGLHKLLGWDVSAK